MNHMVFVRQAVEELETYIPGLSEEEARDKYNLPRVIKLASNENPLGVSPLVRQAVDRAAGQIFRYPQSGNPRLVKAIAAAHRLKPEYVVVGNGSDEIIDLLIRCRAEPGLHNIVTFRPCFSVYPLRGKLCGVAVRSAPLQEDFSFDWKALQELVDDRTSLVFVTTPDNPSGYCPPARELAALAGRLPAGALLVLDEAYMDFAAYTNGKEDSRLAGYSLLPRFHNFNNIVILRTFSKSYGLAGLRLGYGLMPPVLAEALCKARLPFAVNLLAETAGLAALEDQTFRLATMQAVEEGREYLARGLSALGCRVYPSLANFLMFDPSPKAKLTGADLLEALLQRGVILRRLHSFGLPHFFRISVGNAEENRIALDALRDVL